MKNVFVVLFLLVLSMYGCDSGSGGGSNHISQWDISGTASYTGVVTNVKLAAFYKHLADTDFIIISNVEEVISTGSSFTLSIDLSGQNVIYDDYIAIYMWSDTNDDDLWENGETRVDAEPSGSAVFDIFSAEFDYEDGWLYDPAGSDHEAFVTGDLSGAVLVGNF